MDSKTIATAVILLAFILFGIMYRQEIAALLNNGEEARAFMAGLGVWGPLLLIVINIVQIVIAPIPGYAVYIGAGFLFGALWGGIWGSVGLLLGGMVAMAVGRFLGRPIVQRLIGEETLTRWEKVARSDSALVWGVILLSPIGDAPFLLAGLSSIRFGTILWLTVITRVPAAFAVAAMGAGAVELSWWQMMLIVVVLALPFWLVSRHQDEVTNWFYAQTARLAKRP